MITDPEYLTQLRERYGVYDVLNLVHLSAIGPGWYLLTDVAERFATHRSNINASMLRLRKHGLIEYVSYGAGGTFLWWIKQHPGDEPRPERDYPRWVLKDLQQPKAKVMIRVGQQNEWAERLQVHPGTLRNFLSGRYRRLLDRYEVVSSPMGDIP
jgi:hypothetical protein